MRRIFFCVAVLVLSLFIFPKINHVSAVEQVVTDPVNTCPSYPVISSCNLRYIMQVNVSSLGEMLVGRPGDKNSVKTSASGGLVHGISTMLQTPPVSTREYVSYMANHFRIPGSPVPAYAAPTNPGGGIGFSALTPVLKIWVVMRNLAYFVFAIFFVVSGIMIMIRTKIDPKAAATIQSVLPKIVLSLLLVSFSYAIAGLLVDTMYVALGLVITLASSIDVTLSSGVSVGDLGTKILQRNIFATVFEQATWDSIGNAAQSINIAIQTFFGTGGTIESVSGQLLGFLGGAIGFLIIALAIVWALFQTWLKLLSAYANILLGIIFSPIRLTFDVLPGQKQFEGWVREMLANLLTFPAVLAMILLGQILANTNTGNAPTNVYDGFVPPLIGDSSQQAVQALIGIAMVLTIPKAIDILQEILKAPQNKWGTAWGEAIGFGRGVVSKTAGTGTGFARDVTLGSEADRYRREFKANKEDPTKPAPVDSWQAWLGRRVGAKEVV